MGGMGDDGSIACTDMGSGAGKGGEGGDHMYGSKQSCMQKCGDGLSQQTLSCPFNAGIAQLATLRLSSNIVLKSQQLCVSNRQTLGSSSCVKHDRPAMYQLTTRPLAIPRQTPRSPTQTHATP